jgi:hypothetical protein
MTGENQLKRGCPLTGGAQISMTQSAFERCCAARKQEAEERQDIESDKVCFAYPCLTCQGPPAELTIIDVKQYQLEKKNMESNAKANNTLDSLNSKLFAQLDRLADEKISGDALAAEINRAKAVTDIACQIISVGSLALKARLAFKSGNNTGTLPKMLEG